MLELAAALVLAAAPCETGAVRVLSDFPGASRSACTRDGERFVLSIAPEPGAANPSPWYAAAIETEVAGEIRLTLEYEQAPHRYAPWIRHEDGAWERLPAGAADTRRDGQEAILTFNVEAGRTLLAAQPLRTVEDYDREREALVIGPQDEWRVFGRSVEDRPLHALVAPPLEAGAGWVVLIGRQHPPELPGADAFDGFFETALALRAEGRWREGLIAIPLLNPDGVEAGHWRTNAAGVDLNRDWAALSQPETRAAAALIEAVAGPEGLRLMADFHATRSDLLYWPQDAFMSEAAAGRMACWRAALETAGVLDAMRLRRTRSANPVNAKAVFTDRGVPALTWEAGDDTPAAVSRRLAAAGAQAWAQGCPAPGGERE